MKHIAYITLIVLGISILPNLVSAQVMCTMEAKMCPDGSYVGRTGPNCEFTACPGETPTTPALTCPTLSLSLRTGQTSSQVTALQNYLFPLYGVSTQRTGYFGTITRMYVMRFQREHGLTADGLVGPATRGAIKTVCGGGVVVNPAPQTPPATCKVWFDGCNVCSRSEVGGAMACTMRACLWANQAAATCQQSF